MERLLWIGMFLMAGRLTGGTATGGQPLGPARGDSSAQSQGIEGIVYAVSGNQMPSPDHKPGAHRGVKSTVYVFERTNISQVTRQGQTAYYLMINTKLVKQADTDDTGYFRIKLPPGAYSIFTRKGDLFYASRRDEKNNIAPVEVVAGKFTRIDCKIEGDRKPIY